jgi:4-hydroxy-4-methyl-2-oxoglutarate aldolase
MSSDIVAKLKMFPTGVICDALGRLGLSGFMDGVRPFRRDVKMAGRARTVQYGPRRGDDGPRFNIYAFMRSLEPGDIVVFGTNGAKSWMYGENMAHAALYAKLAGVVSDSMARDADQLADLEIPCFAAGSGTRPPVEIEFIATDTIINCAGAQVHSGDVLVGDGDGIVVVPGRRATDVLFQAEELDDLEGQQERAIASQAPMPELAAILGKKKIVRK